jgi:hypothetical protein
MRSPTAKGSNREGDAMRLRTLLMGSLAVLMLGGLTQRAGAQDWGGEMGRWHALCDHGDRRACVRFGILIGEHRDHEAEWRRSHPEWYWWER